MASAGEISVAFRAFTGGFTAGIRTMTAGVDETVAKLNASRNPLAKTAGQFSVLGQAAVRAAAPLATVAAAMAPFAAGAAIFGGLRQAEQFNRAMANSTAIMVGLSDTMRGNMVTAAEEVAFTTKFSMKEAAEAYFFLASAGLDAQQSIAALPAVAKFAQAGNFDLALATDLLTDAQSALGMTSKDAQENLLNMQRVSNVLVKANTLANASVQQFSESLTNKAGAAIKIVGKDIEEGVAVLAAFADQGVKGAEAGTALNIVFRDLQTRALAGSATFKQFGIEVFDSSGEMNNIATIIGQLETALAGMSDETAKATLQQLGFQDKSVAFIQTLLGTSEKMAMYEQAMRDAGNMTEEVASKQLTPFQAGINKLAAVWERFAIQVGTPILDQLGSTLQTTIVPAFVMATDLLGGIVAFFVEWEGTITLVAAAIAGVATVMMAVAAAQKAIAIGQAIITGLTGNFAALAVGMGVAVGSMAMIESLFNKIEHQSTAAVTQSNNVAESLVNVGSKSQDVDRSVASLESLVEAAENAETALAGTSTQFSEAFTTATSAVVGANSQIAKLTNQMAKMSQLGLSDRLNSAVSERIVGGFSEILRNVNQLEDARDTFASMANAGGMIGEAAAASAASINTIRSSIMDAGREVAASHEQLSAGLITMQQHEANVQAAVQGANTTIAAQVSQLDQLQASVAENVKTLGGFAEAESERKRLLDSLLTPQQRLAQEQEKLNALFELFGDQFSAEQQTQAFADAMERFDESIGGPAAKIRELEQELYKLNNNLSDSQFAMLQLAGTPGITDDQIRQIEQLTNQLDRKNRAAEIAESVQTPLEKLKDDFAELQSLGPELGQDVFAKASQQLAAPFLSMIETPADKLAADLESLNFLAQQGVISPEQFQQIGAKMFEQLQEQPIPFKMAEAVDLTTGGVGAAFRSVFSGRNSTANRELAEAEKTNKQLAESKALFEQMLAEIKAGPKIVEAPLG